MASMQMPRFEDEPALYKNEPAYCRKECNHADCRCTREMRAKPCLICGKEFKAHDGVYHEENGYVHTRCLEDKIIAEDYAKTNR